ncbi:MAG: Trk system potassium transporter TrkA [Calditrichaeota bacterium]|nr:MAG: Trk system potassium transporter TrkA [Calditrichota bacterium]
MKVLISGAGSVGFQLARRLSAEKHDITIIECDPERARRAREQLDALVVEDHGASLRALRRADVEHAEIFAALTNNDEVNLLGCKLAKKLGVARTIARVRNPELTLSDFVLTPEELGVDRIIHPEKETADAVIRLIRRAGATDVIEFEQGKVQIVGIRLERESPLLRIPLKELTGRYGDPPMRIVAIHRRVTTVIPRGDDVLVEGDQVFIVCDPGYLPEFVRLAGKADTRIENVMILGGGLIGQFIARELSESIHVKIIESNAERSQEIAEILPRALIIHGDGTDIDLLALEGITDMDAFIAVTGDDETNIIATLVARHLRVPRTIALVNKVEYLPITPTIGMDAVVSKQLITVNAVQRFIRHHQIAELASLPGIDAEVIEFVAAKGSRITRKPIKDLNFPKGAIVGAVLHDGRLIIPKGDTRIQPGDRVVVFSLPVALHNLSRYFD